MTKRRTELVKEQEERKAERKVGFSTNSRTCCFEHIQSCTCFRCHIIESCWKYQHESWYRTLS